MSENRERVDDKGERFNWKATPGGQNPLGRRRTVVALIDTGEARCNAGCKRRGERKVSGENAMHFTKSRLNFSRDRIFFPSYPEASKKSRSFRETHCAYSLRVSLHWVNHGKSLFLRSELRSLKTDKQRNRSGSQSWRASSPLKPQRWLRALGMQCSSRGMCSGTRKHRTAGKSTTTL